MKKFLALAALAVLSISANAQTSEVGKITVTPQAGYVFAGGYSSSTYIEGAESYKLESVSKPGYVIGAEVGYQAKKWLKPSVGVFYYHGGLDAKYAGEKFGEARMSYLNVPVLLNFYVAKGLALKAGVQPAFLLSAKSQMVKGQTVDSKDGIKSFDFSIPVGISYEFKNLVLDARVNIPTGSFLKKGYEISAAGLNIDKLENSYMSFSLGYKFELGK